MAKGQLQWNNVNVGNPNAGMGYAIEGNKMLQMAIENLRKPFDLYSKTQDENAENEKQANTAKAIQAIMAGQEPDLEGKAYDGALINEATRQKKLDQESSLLNQANMANLQSLAKSRNAMMANNDMSESEQLEFAENAYINRLVVDRKNDIERLKEGTLGLKGKSSGSSGGSYGKKGAKFNARTYLSGIMKEKYGSNEESVSDLEENTKLLSNIAKITNDPRATKFIIDNSISDVGAWKIFSDDTSTNTSMEHAQGLFNEYTKAQAGVAARDAILNQQRYPQQ